MKQEKADATFRTARDLLDWLDAEAARLGVSRSAVINMRLNRERQRDESRQAKSQRDHGAGVAA